MKITRGKTPFKPDLIITADWHLMEKERQPPCRTDDYWTTQWDKVNQILELQNKYHCPIIIAGDVFEHWKTSPYLLNTCINHLKSHEIYSIIGNHDMPQHNIGLMSKSGLETLFSTGTIKYLTNHLDWEIKKHGKPLTIKGRTVLFAHRMVWQGDMPWPGCPDPEINQIFKQIPNIDLIVTGHNHKTIAAKQSGRLIINPGSITRHKADQGDHHPCVFLWNADQNSFKKHYLTINKECFSRQYIEDKNDKIEKSMAFISSLKKRWGIGFSFSENIETRLKENKVPDNIKRFVYKWMDKEV